MVCPDNAEDLACLKWFESRTSRKLPGIFESSFWNTLVFQAIVAEPAVLHATLALTSSHQEEIHSQKSPVSKEGIPNDREQFMLRQYSKAIGHLQKHFSVQKLSSVRVVLVTCILFINLEFLCGHYKSGLAHLHNGLNLLDILHSRRSVGNISFSNQIGCCETVDDWLADPFQRLHVQAALFGQCSHIWHTVVGIEQSGIPLPTFKSLNQARWYLERMLIEIVQLRARSRPMAQTQNPPGSHVLLEQQHYIKLRLRNWLASYMKIERSAGNPYAYHILRMYHTMAEIMVDISFESSASKSSIQSHTGNFLSIIAKSVQLWDKICSNPGIHISPEVDEEMSNTITDMGWIPPLYFTATNCRSHRIRLHAIRLIESMPHREGIWDSTLAASISREVMNLEEGNFYQNDRKIDDFLVTIAPVEHDSLQDCPPETSWVYDLQIMLPENSMGGAELKCRRRRNDGNWREISRKYNIISNSWEG